MGYVPPGSEKIKTTLFVMEKKEVDKMLGHIKLTWLTYKIIIPYYGWTNVAHHPLINMMMSYLNGPIFFQIPSIGKLFSSRNSPPFPWKN